MPLPSPRHRRGVARTGLLFALPLGLVACAVQTPPVQPVESPRTVAEQRGAQQAVASAQPASPQLKWKIALGRISNETQYGQSLLRDAHDDPLGKQVTDLLSKALTESGSFLVFERPDISRVQAENALTGDRSNLIGVDALLVGSLTEFGRKTVGQTGFVSSSKRQVAFAKVDVRVVDVKTGHVGFATSGAGEASTETASTFGFGSQASYDGTLNDAAIRQAVSQVVSRLASDLQSRPWQTAILKADGKTLYVSGGRSQGLRPGMEFDVATRGEQVKSPQTGALVTLPGQVVGRLKIDSLFGSSDLDEGAVATLISGSLGNRPPDQLVIRAQGGAQ